MQKVIERASNRILELVFPKVSLKVFSIGRFTNVITDKPFVSIGITRTDPHQARNSSILFWHGAANYEGNGPARLLEKRFAYRREGPGQQFNIADSLRKFPPLCDSATTDL